MSALSDKQAVFITGAGSGIGQATAKRLLAEGYTVWATSRDIRRLAGLAGVHPLEMDFQKADSVDRAWNRAVDESGGIDILIQNAGRGWFGSIEETSPEAARSQWVDLVDGPLRLLQLAAAHMRPRGRGYIMGVSSLAGEMPMPFFSHYSAGKAALSAFLAGLWMELRPFGIRVVDLRPGDIRTPFNEAVIQADGLIPLYSPWQNRAWEESCRLIAEAPEPGMVACEILRLLRDKNPPAVKRCGPWFQVVAASWAARLFPRSWVLAVTRAYYRLDRPT